MIRVRIEHAVPDYDKWKRLFDSDPADRRGSGVRRYQILRALDDPNYVFIDLDFEDVESAEAFLRRMQALWEGPGKTVMQGPRARVLEHVQAEELR
jgi:hypothetical protein